MKFKRYLEAVIVGVAVLTAFVTDSYSHTPEVSKKVVSTGSRDTGIRPILDLRPKVTKPTKEEIQKRTKQVLTAKLPKHYGYVDKKEADKLVKLVYKEAGSRKIDPILVLGLIAAESSFNKDSVSPVGAKGYTQVMPKYHEDKIKGRDIFHPAVNVQVGVKILHDCMRSRKSERMALACYNGARAKADIEKYIKAVYKHRNNIQRLAKL